MTTTTKLKRKPGWTLLLRDVPRDLERAIRARARADQRALRPTILRLLAHAIATLNHHPTP